MFVRPGGDADPAVVLVVLDRVVEHVVHHPAHQRLAARHPGCLRAGGVVHGQVPGGDRAGPHREGRGGEVLQRERGAAGQVAVLRPGERQEPVEQAVDPVEFAAQPVRQGDRLCGHGLRLGHCDIDAGPHGGQWGAQLVRGVGDEPPLRGERTLQPLQQPVDGVGEVLQLVPGTGHGQPLVQAVRRDPPGGHGHLPQRAEHPAGHDPAEHQRDHGHDAQRDRRPDHQAVRDARVDLSLRGRQLCLQLVDPDLVPGQRGRHGLVRRHPRHPGRGHDHAAADGQQHRTGHHEQGAVQGGQPHPHGAARQHAREQHSHFLASLLVGNPGR